MPLFVMEKYNFSIKKEKNWIFFHISQERLFLYYIHIL